jgi:hypothetical protein
MFWLFEPALFEMIEIAPELFLLCGMPDRPRLRRPRFLAVRTGNHRVHIEA